LQRVAGRFTGHPVRGELVQFLINKREQLLGGIRIALLSAVEDVGDVANERRLCDYHGMWNLERKQNARCASGLGRAVQAPR
jgi:hypothetical protein